MLYRPPKFTPQRIMWVRPIKDTTKAHLIKCTYQDATIKTVLSWNYNGGTCAQPSRHGNQDCGVPISALAIIVRWNTIQWQKSKRPQQKGQVTIMRISHGGQGRVGPLRIDLIDSTANLKTLCGSCIALHLNQLERVNVR